MKTGHWRNKPWHKSARSQRRAHCEGLFWFGIDPETARGRMMLRQINAAADKFFAKRGLESRGTW